MIAVSRGRQAYVTAALCALAMSGPRRAGLGGRLWLHGEPHDVAQGRRHVLFAARGHSSSPAMYYGDPIPAKKNLADDDGSLGLGEESVTIPGASRTAVITGTKFDIAHLGWVTSLDVLVNVYTARRTTADNLLGLRHLPGHRRQRPGTAGPDRLQADRRELGRGLIPRRDRAEAPRAGPCDWAWRPRRPAPSARSGWRRGCSRYCNRRWMYEVVAFRSRATIASALS